MCLFDGARLWFLQPTQWDTAHVGSSCRHAPDLKPPRTPRSPGRTWWNPGGTVVEPYLKPPRTTPQPSQNLVEPISNSDFQWVVFFFFPHFSSKSTSQRIRVPVGCFGHWKSVCVWPIQLQAPIVGEGRPLCKNSEVFGLPPRVACLHPPSPGANRQYVIRFATSQKR